jgi:hypothetical protein
VTIPQNTLARKFPKLRHGDATQSQRRRIAAQGDSLERAERVTCGEGARGGCDQGIHERRLPYRAYPVRSRGDRLHQP